MSREKMHHHPWCDDPVAAAGEGEDPPVSQQTIKLYLAGGAGGEVGWRTKWNYSGSCGLGPNLIGSGESVSG